MNIDTDTLIKEASKLTGKTVSKLPAIMVATLIAVIGILWLLLPSLGEDALVTGAFVVLFIIIVVQFYIISELIKENTNARVLLARVIPTEARESTQNLTNSYE